MDKFDRLRLFFFKNNLSLNPYERIETQALRIPPSEEYSFSFCFKMVDAVDTNWFPRLFMRRIPIYNIAEMSDDKCLPYVSTKQYVIGNDRPHHIFHKMNERWISENKPLSKDVTPVKEYDIHYQASIPEIPTVFNNKHEGMTLRTGISRRVHLDKLNSVLLSVGFCHFMSSSAVTQDEFDALQDALITYQMAQNLKDRDTYL